MNTVVCVKVRPKYDALYVNRLYSMVKRHTSKEIDFVCITDDPEGILKDVRILPAPRLPGVFGWWTKLSLFGAYDFGGERIVYLDLDTVIVGNVDFLFDYDGPFAILRDFYASGHYGSAIMSIAPRFGEHIWKLFEANPMSIQARHWGDQAFIQQCVEKADLWQDLYPGRIGSYKADSLAESPRDFAICCFHGEPKPHEVNGWVKDAW